MSQRAVYDRPARRAAVMALRETGMTYAQIAEELGFSRSHVCELVNDPDRSKADARRARSLGRPVSIDTTRRCSEGCGTRLNSYNASGVCGACTVELSQRRVAQALAEREDAAALSPVRTGVAALLHERHRETPPHKGDTMAENATIAPIPTEGLHGVDVVRSGHSAPSPCGISGRDRLPTDGPNGESRAGESSGPGETHPLLTLFPSCAAVHEALTHPRYRGGWLEAWRVAEATGLTAPLTHAALRRLERAGLVVRRRGERGVAWRAA